MAYINATTRTTAIRQDRMLGFFAQFGQMVSRYRLYRQTLAELQQLSERELNDLGISSCDVAAIAREAVYGK